MDKNLFIILRLKFYYLNLWVLLICLFQGINPFYTKIVFTFQNGHGTFLR